MAEKKLPYMNAYGSITRTLKKIKSAATPDRFTQDFLATKLGLTGGSAKPVIPYLKRTGFLGSDGVPTEQYKRFRNPQHSGRAAAQGLRVGYSPLYEMNEYAHELSDDDLLGLIVQATGLDAKSQVASRTQASFKALRDFATFDDSELPSISEDEIESSVDEAGLALVTRGLPEGVNVSYTINLNLPATSDIAVFNAIFKSIRENILRE